MRSNCGLKSLYDVIIGDDLGMKEGASDDAGGKLFCRVDVAGQYGAGEEDVIASVGFTDGVDVIFTKFCVEDADGDGPGYGDGEIETGGRLTVEDETLWSGDGRV